MADVVWQRAPTDVCLVLDDVHLLRPGSWSHQPAQKDPLRDLAGVLLLTFTGTITPLP